MSVARRAWRSRRDTRLRSAALQTDQFTRAGFSLTQPVALTATPEIGVPIKLEAVGDLNLHGVTKPATFQLEARWDGPAIVVSGNTDIALADYGIDPPNVGGFVNVGDSGVIEFQLIFVRTGTP